MKKIIKTLALLCFAIVISFTCFACDIYCGKNPNNDSGNYDNGQNEIEDVTPTYNSISEATSALSSSLSSEQKIRHCRLTTSRISAKLLQAETIIFQVRSQTQLQSQKTQETFTFGWTTLTSPPRTTVQFPQPKARTLLLL